MFIRSLTVGLAAASILASPAGANELLSALYFIGPDGAPHRVTISDQQPVEFHLDSGWRCTVGPDTPPNPVVMKCRSEGGAADERTFEGRTSAFMRCGFSPLYVIWEEGERATDYPVLDRFEREHPNDDPSVRTCG